MATEDPGPVSSGRRGFIHVAAGLAGAAALPFSRAQAPATARYRRVNVNDPVLGPPALASYKRAIRAMLQLDARDPRNWYRIALTHAIDCPHGNWWFLVWHRAYLGWFERICRELSGDPQFALPYWDWTENLDPAQPFRPALPAAMFDDVLTPTHPAFIADAAEFRARFGEVIAKESYWNRVLDASGMLSKDCQYAQLLARGIRFPEDLWFDVFDDPRGAFFFERTKARGLTAAQPTLDAETTKAVSLPMVLDALAARDFITFTGARTMSHGTVSGFSVLEAQPHNMIHKNVGGVLGDKNVGGFMQNNLSPVDPVFFLHHANLDRLWDVWTRKQKARGYPPLPVDNELKRWSNEPFLFFVDEKGGALPPAKQKAGAYAEMAEFGYDYQPGSGEIVVPASAPAPAPAPAAPQSPVAARLSTDRLGGGNATIGTVEVPRSLLQGGAAVDSPRLYAQIEVETSALAHGVSFDVMVNATDRDSALGPASPHHAATLSMFGHHAMHGPVTYTVALSGALDALRAKQLLSADRPLQIQVIARTPASHHGGAMAHATRSVAQVNAITVEMR